MAQLSSIMMQYIDAAMVGHLGADESAAVGLVSTSLWLFWGSMLVGIVGFSVQVAHRMGAADYKGARSVLRQGLLFAEIFGSIMALIGCGIAAPLPRWLGGEGEKPYAAERRCISPSSWLRFRCSTLNYLGGAVLRATGNMKVAGGVNVLMCVLDVVFNFFFIFPTRSLELWGMDIAMPGMGLGVLGAALGTCVCRNNIGLATIWYATMREKDIAIFGRHAVHNGRKEPNRWHDFIPTGVVLRNALKVSAPMTLEHGVMWRTDYGHCDSGTFRRDGHSRQLVCRHGRSALAIMPGYGIGDAATTLVGQSYGARRKDLARQLHHRGARYGGDDSNGSNHVARRAGSYGTALTRDRDTGIRRISSAHRGMGRTHVRRLNRGLRGPW